MSNPKPVRALNLDINSQKIFIKFFNNLGEKSATTVRIFDRIDFYSVHGDEDSEVVSKIVFKSTSFVKIMSPGEVPDLPYVVLNKADFEKAVRELLLLKNFRVEVYTNKKSGKSSDWQIEFKGSPGNLVQFEDVLFNNNEMISGNAVVALQMKNENNQKLIGLACVETNDCLFSVTEFTDNDFYGELEAIAVLLGPKECLLPSADDEFGKIKMLMERNGVSVTVRKKSDFASAKSDIVQDLNNLIRFQKGQQPNANSLPDINKNIAISALGAAIKYLDLVNDAANLSNFELKQLNLKRFVHLDAAAVSALNILPKPGTSANSPGFRWQSILGVLDRCRTAQGHRLMAQWVKQPLRSPETLKDRHDIVQCLSESQTVLNDLHDDFLKRIPDVMALIKKLIRKKASLQDVFRIYQVLIRAPRLVMTLNNLENSAIKSVICDPIKEALEDLIMLKQMVEQVVDLEAVQNGEYMVKATFDEQLQEMKEKMDEITEKMNKLLAKAANDLDLEKGTSLKLDYVSHLGYHFRISLKDDAILRKKGSYKVLDAIKGGVRFTNDKLSEYNQDFQETRELYEEQQKSIVDEVVRVAAGYMAPLAALNNHIAQLDCLVSFAVAANTAPIPYVRPKMVLEGSGVLELKNVRHPCLELQEGVTYIANDVNFRKDETCMYIITGPNMGGKSTYIRSVGTSVLMAHIGSFVACETATISMVDSILGRIGAGDNIVKGLSTFMMEMIETSGIIRTATDKSLVIIDELGRGTSTYEGCGIAWSIAEHLAKETKCFTLFATHFHEITELADDVPDVKNYHMAAVADDENFTLLYIVKPGVTDKSFGIQIAKLADFPENVVNLAQRMYNECEDHFAHLKTGNDAESMQKVNDIIELRSNSWDTLDVAELRRLTDEIVDEIKKSDTSHFKKLFPELFSSSSD